MGSADQENARAVTCDMPISERARKKRQIFNARKIQYFALRFILPSKNVCKRLFSVAGIVLSYRSQGINLSNL